jgi:hypothetical protein
MKALALITALALVPVLAHAAAPVGLCSASETVFLSCRTKEKKWISLCGALPKSVQYRFGTRARPELLYPEKAEEGPQKLRYAHYFRFQVDRMEVSFSNLGVEYSVFDYHDGADRHAGVRVKTTDGKEHEFPCIGTVSGRLVGLQDTLPCDADSALTGGNCP